MLINQMNNERIVIIGGGGHAKMCIDILRQYKRISDNIYGIVDSNLAKGEKVLGIPVIGDDNDLEKIFNCGIQFAVIGFGALSNPKSRQRMYIKLKSIGYILPNIVHMYSIIEDSASLGEGNQVMAGAIIGSDAKIGDNCIVNSGSIVSHDCVLKDNVHITPGAILGGTVTVGNNTIIGMGATVLYQLKIGDDVVVTNGSKITKDISDSTFVKMSVR